MQEGEGTGVAKATTVLRLVLVSGFGEGDNLGAEQQGEQHHYEQIAPKLALHHRHNSIVKEKRTRERALLWTTETTGQEPDN